MEKKWLLELGISDEQAKEIFAEYGKSVQSEIERRKTAEENVKNLTSQLEKSQEELKQFSEISAQQEDFKEKFENLTKEIQSKHEQEQKLAQEQKRLENLTKRFEQVEQGKTWTHTAVRQNYLNEFVKNLTSEENAGRSDVDIFNDLVKNDDCCFKTHDFIQVAGGSVGALVNGDSRFKTRDEIIKIKDPAERQKEILNNPDLFPELSKEK